MPERHEAKIPHFCAVVAEYFLEREGACQWQAPIAKRRTRPPRRDAERHEAKIPHFCAVVAEYFLERPLGTRPSYYGSTPHIRRCAGFEHLR